MNGNGRKKNEKHRKEKKKELYTITLIVYLLPSYVFCLRKRIISYKTQNQQTSYIYIMLKIGIVVRIQL